MKDALREIRIQSARLELRMLSVEDAQWLFKLHQFPEVLKYLDFPAWTELSQAVDYCLDNESHFSAKGYGFWAVNSAESGSAMGLSGVRHNPENGNPELIYRFFPEYWAQGYATEAALAVLDYMFLNTEVSTVFARTQSANASSIRVLDKCGFRIDQNSRYKGGNERVFSVSKLLF